jgi:hypothetical protein
MTEKQLLTPIEAINEFYRLKDKYENVYYEKYVQPIVKSNKSKREKRVEYSKLPKHECFNCKRNVETIFNIRINRINNDSIKTFIVKCGDFKEPCPLDIQINYDFRDKFDKLIKEGLERIEKIKLKIIKEKNNAIFFSKDVVQIFDKITQELKRETENCGFVIETNLLRNDNPEKIVSLKQTIDEFGKEYILPFKKMVKDYMDTNNELILNQASNFYVNEMIPKLKEIQILKYNVNMVEFDNNTYKLIQLPNSLESNEFFSGSNDKVIKFVRGVKKEKKKTKKEETQPNKKTRKVKPVAELVLEEDEDEEFVTDVNLTNKYAKEPDIKPVFDNFGNTIIGWNNEEYDNLWKKMPAQLKNLLAEDTEWIQDFMNECIKSKKTGSPCNLFLPKQTIFPPHVLEDGKYDFESEIINKLFNSLSKSQQDRLLKLYSVKDGVTNYDMLKNSLTTILEQNINSFNKGKF